MCGIAGYFNPDQNYAENPKQNFHTLSRMINTMNHRGPDTYGHTIINSCCLAHTRLSIIDLENGRQPMSYTKDGNTYYIVRTYNNRKGRAITGFSMGGHGALWLAFRHPDTYGACGSISGGVDIRPFPENWEMKQLLGPYSENPQRWNEYTVINQLPYNSKSGPLAIIIDCGYYDFFYTVNQKLHEKLRYYNIPHDFLTRPGGHTHEYWNNAIDYQLLFFYKYFHPN